MLVGILYFIITSAKQRMIIVNFHSMAWFLLVTSSDKKQKTPAGSWLKDYMFVSYWLYCLYKSTPINKIKVGKH